ncbi:hypothetical protein ABE288_07745 [Bacillus salipaludis]|uniref:hypothetical protein n=1 Tax=Bacillus salipaludis TaxID=2547811 RepID=UPI003D1E3BE4
MIATIIYDHRFNANEWFGIIGLCLGLFLMIKLPSLFPRKITILFFLSGLTFGTFADHYIGTIPKSFYDTGNTSDFDLTDVPSLLMYGPFSYLFFYIYDVMKIKTHFIPSYILFWSLASTSFEWLSLLEGEYHYHSGYWLGISFMVYLLVLSTWIIFYHLIYKHVTE